LKATDGTILVPGTALPGCIKFKTLTTCEICTPGNYILATEDQSCYNLAQTRTDTELIDITTQDKREPCAKAKNKNECSECQPGDTIGFV
jgi:hypothetical protein